MKISQKFKPPAPLIIGDEKHLSFWQRFWGSYICPTLNGFKFNIRFKI